MTKSKTASKSKTRVSIPLKKKTPVKSSRPVVKKVEAEIVDDHEAPGNPEPSDKLRDELGDEIEFGPPSDFEVEQTPAKTPAVKPPPVATKAVAKLGPKALTKAADPITAYLNEVRKYPLLSKEEEFALAKRYYETKDPEAAQALVTANLRFVVKVAAEYSKFGARLIDLVQEGNMGLMHAVRDYNPYKGVRLITYAVWWIRGYIQEYLLKQYSMVKIATTLNQKKLFYRLQKEKDALDALGEAPDMKTIGERLGIPVEEVEQMANRLSGRDVSLNQPVDEGSASSLMDLQKSLETGVDDQLAAREELGILREKLEELREHLSDREKIILEERLLADEPLTLQEIGEKYGITREAVRQMEVRLMKKIKEKYFAGVGNP